MFTIRPGDHFGAAFTGRREFAANARSFIRQGLAVGAKVVVCPAGEAHDEIQRLIAGPGDAAGVPVEFAGATMVRPGGFDADHLLWTLATAADSAVADGHSGLWVTADMWAVAGGVDPGALTALEAASFPLFADGRLTVLCQYDTDGFPAEQVRDVCQAHPANVSVQWRQERVPGGLRLSGEADLSNRLAWAAAIGALPAEVHLDVTDMSFLDVPAMVALIHAALARPGMTLTVTSIQARVLDTLGIGETPAAVIVAPDFATPPTVPMLS